MGRILLSLGLIGVYLAWLPKAAVSQAEPPPVQAEWSVGKAPDRGWTVGDPIPLYLTTNSPGDVQVTLPELPDRWGPFEVLEQMPVDAQENADGTRTLVREATVTLWAPGIYETPSFAAHYQDKEGAFGRVRVPPLSISVASVLQEGESQKRDLKPQAALPAPTLWPWLLGGFLVALVGGLTGWGVLRRLMLRPETAIHARAVSDERPPHDVAYAELKRISALDLPSRGEFKQHYSLVADCLRTYVQGRYHIPALDQTTEELAAAMRENHVDRRHVTPIRELLAEADLVKFAKYRPGIGRAHSATARARHIVDITKTTDLKTAGELPFRAAGDPTDLTPTGQPRTPSRPGNHESTDS